MTTFGTIHKPQVVYRRRSWAWAWLSFAVIAVIPALSWGDDWPQWRGPNRNGVSAETNWLVNWPPIEEWRRPVGVGYSSVAVSEGRVYTMGYTNATARDYVYCLDALSGTQCWASGYSSGTVDYEGTRATPTVDGTNVYTYSHQGYLYCFDKITGTYRWNKTVNTGRNASWGLSSSPLIEGDLVIVNAGGAGVAIDKNGAHNVVWNSSGDASFSSPIAFTYNAKRVVAFFTPYGLYGRDPLNGKTNWWFSWAWTYNIADPVLYSDKVFISSGYDKGSALVQLGSGARTSVWQSVGGSAVMKNHINSSVLVGNYLYGFDDNFDDAARKLQCIDVRTGTAQWSTNGFGSLIAADGKLIVLKDNGELLIVNASPTFNIVRPAIKVIKNAELQTWWTAPVLANGRIYCRSHEGTLVCLRVGPPPADLDGDGIADTWEVQNFGGTNNCAPNGDSDSDGFMNLSEYVAGTSPTNAASSLRMQIVFTNGSVAVTWPTVAAAGLGYEGYTRYYSLETRTNLTAGNWQPVPGFTNILGDNSIFSYTNGAADNVESYRAKVRLE